MWCAANLSETERMRRVYALSLVHASAIMQNVAGRSATNCERDLNDVVLWKPISQLIVRTETTERFENAFGTSVNVRTVDAHQISPPRNALKFPTRNEGKMAK